ncbi:hypothetical protein JAAARDRAFT_209942 [Jaapia argillacea MUCL 33604]|uniref:BTB domain-containing protein n=1 Tax=Jaapia argillacea MUCL 33604 TaxID=933084 RepID=A0A067PTC0_9AGAM|nr:hypothetical protein JAAARDRAFT_209942 [Jaapia argillacea MUCL 33604]
MSYPHQTDSAMDAKSALHSKTWSDASLSPTASDVSDFEDVGEGESSLPHAPDGGSLGSTVVGEVGTGSVITSHHGGEVISHEPASLGGSAGVRDAVSGGHVGCPTASSGALIIPKKHDSFYMDYDMAVFLVEDTLFRVHSFFFKRDSEYFRTLLSQYGPSSEKCPVQLDGVSVADLETFLGVLYPSDFSKHTATTVDEWTSVLALATKWSFTTIRSLAIRELFPLASPIDKIVVGRQYDIPEWLQDAYIAVCERPEALTKKEGERLGLDEVIKISQLRQDVRTGAVLLERGEILTFVGAIAPPNQKAPFSAPKSADGPEIAEMLRPGPATVMPVPSDTTPFSQAHSTQPPDAEPEEEMKQDPVPITYWNQLLALSTAPTEEEFGKDKRPAVSGMTNELQKIEDDLAASRGPLGAKDAREMADIKAMLGRTRPFEETIGIYTHCYDVPDLTSLELWELAKRLKHLGSRLSMA